MKVLADPDQMRRLGARWRARGETIALVPTMGALHAGHRRLLDKARGSHDRLVVSIYVNPTQFGPKEDFKKYPRPRTDDLAFCRSAGADAVFAPTNLYAEDASTWVNEESVSTGRCGGARPGHFRGVATVVLKLFNIVQPDAAFFGEKDAQQLEVIQRMARDLFVPVRIVAAPTVREPDGLALSSRNRYLSPRERTQALALPRGLRAATGRRDAAKWLASELKKAPGVKLDYVEESAGRLCAAIFVGTTRLIDNWPLTRR